MDQFPRGATAIVGAATFGIGDAPGLQPNDMAAATCRPTSTAAGSPKYGIRANSVSFGVVEPPMAEPVRSEKFRDTFMARIPPGRFTQPEEAAAPVCFLLSEAASYVTGQLLSVNGGLRMSL